MRRRRLFKAIIVGIVTLVALAGAEVVLRLRNLRDAPRRDNDAWHRFDPTLGWLGTPGYEGAGEAPVPEGTEPLRFGVRLNGQGWRSPREFTPAPAPGTRRICWVGDSFTFGFGCAEPEGCVARLDQLLGPGVEVLNQGTCAYGVDQMRLVAERHALPLQPDLVLIGVMSQNFRRALRTVSIIGHRKPRYVLAGDGIRLCGVPVPPLEEQARRSFSDLPPEGGSFLRWQLGKLGDRIRVGLAGGAEEARPRWRLGAAILRDAARLCREAGVRFAVVLYPTRKYLAKGDPQRPLLAGLAPQVLCCDTYPAFEAVPEARRDELFIPDGHPSPAGHALIAEAVAAFIREQGLLEAN